jgi:superfamily I DNA/RNA helicase
MRVEAAAGKPALRKLIVLELTSEQRSAADAPLDECFAILGAAGSGKSTALAQRVARIRDLCPEAEPLLVGAGYGLDEYAADLLRQNGMGVTLVDDVEAERLFAEACLPLFAMDWAEFAQNRLDPEVPGLRSPERFLQSAFRLIRRLRDAGVEPALLLARSLTGATEFYANPPNFADPALLYATKSAYHDSLDANADELQRQRRREIDLAKILAKLYESYAKLVRSASRMTGRDAILAATHLLRNNAELAAALRKRHRFALLDNAQDLTGAQLAFLIAIFGEQLAGVTLCGDPSSAFDAARMTHPESTFALARSKVELRAHYRNPRREVERLSTARAEAAFIAERVDAWLAEGVRPEKIAVLFRSVHNVEIYEDALLERDIPAVVAGDVNVFADRRALDALALLWNVNDPFRHDWLLRTLSNPALGLSDATLAILCSEPPDPQRPLFTFDDEPAPTVRASRWNSKRDLRLGWNVIRGELDDALTAEARTRVRRFRRLREGWLETMPHVSFDEFARTVWSEGLAREGDPGSARARAQQVALQRLLDRLDEYMGQNADATLADVVEYAERRMASAIETCLAPGRIEGQVELLSVEAARGREFDHVVVANVRPGAFPRWYSPDAFLFSPRLGMIPKENVGEARSSRTAKFSYYMFRSKASQHYYARERRAFAYAVTRARRSVLVTASGAPTRGVKAPEFLEELR